MSSKKNRAFFVYMERKKITEAFFKKKILYFIKKIESKTDSAKKIQVGYHLFGFLVEHRYIVCQRPCYVNMIKIKLREFENTKQLQAESAWIFLHSIINERGIVFLQRRWRFIRFLRWTKTRKFAEWFYAPGNFGAKHAKYIISKVLEKI